MIDSFDATVFSRRHTVLALSALWVFALPNHVMAQISANPYVSAQFEHDSNVFRVPDSAVATQNYGGPQLSDNDLRYIAGVEGTYLWSEQKLSATLEGRKIDYDHFTFLDHSEYLANINLDWKLASLLDGLLQFRQEHLAAYFADEQSPGLEVNTDRNIVAKLNLKVRTDWRLETGVNFHTYDSPLQFYPDFAEHEVGSHLGVSYLGVSNLTYGVALDHISGKFTTGTATNDTGVGPYRQSSAGLQTTYLITGLTTLDGALGYTRRDQSGNEQSVGTVTGLFKYKRQLTGKTSLTAQFQRAFYSYAASAGSEIDSTGSVGADWQATYKLGVGIKFAYTRTTFVGQAIPGSTTEGRLDHSPAETLNITYQALRNLQIKGYFNGQRRSSNIYYDTYHDTTVGIQATAHWR